MDDDYLRLALNEAQEAFKRGDIPVGAVLSNPTNNIIGRVGNKMYSNGGILYHAEMLLIINNQEYIWKNKPQLTIYSSLEPCIMCMSAAILHGVTRFVWITNDYWAGGTRSLKSNTPYITHRSIELIQSQSIELQEESIRLLARWYTERRPELLSKVLGL